jgi:hypothetical protein
MSIDKITVKAMKLFLRLQGLQVLGLKKELVDHIISHQERVMVAVPLQYLLLVALDCILKNLSLRLKVMMKMRR